ncbi:hypothetical protein ACI65C_011034 [Semiaphis heraclei]
MAQVDMRLTDPNADDHRMANSFLIVTLGRIIVFSSGLWTAGEARRGTETAGSCPPYAPPAHNAGARGYQTTVSIVANILPSNGPMNNAMQVRKNRKRQQPVSGQPTDGNTVTPTQRRVDDDERRSVPPE